MGVSGNAKLIEKAVQIVDSANELGISMRILGAIATKLHCSPEITSGEMRDVSDIDFMAYSKHRKEIKKTLLDKFNYLPNDRFEALYGKDRFIFYDEDGIAVDVFFDKLPMCHTIDFAGRLELDSPTITLADLLLTKLQIVNFEEKDFKDVVCILTEHPIRETEDEAVNAKYIAEVLSKDWGFYYTFTSNLNQVKTSLSESSKHTQMLEKIDRIAHYIENEPKSMGWRMRSKVGTKKKWYVDIEYR